MEKDEMIIFVMTMYHKELLLKIFTDDELSNDYEALRKMKKLCKEFNEEKWNNEDYDLEDITEKFLLHKIEIKKTV